MNIYVQTCDKGIHIIEAFQYLFNRYWSEEQPVTVLGYAEPEFELAPNFSFVSLGKDTGPQIGGQLIDFFSGIEDEHFVYTVDSQVIIRPVQIRRFKELARFIEGSAKVGRVALTGDMEVNQPQQLWRIFNIGISLHSPVADYRMSAIWSIWRKDYFLRYLKPDMNLWEWEIAGSNSAKLDGIDIWSPTESYPITACRIYKHGRPHIGSFWSWDRYRAPMSKDDRVFVSRIMHWANYRELGELAPEETTE